MGNSVPEKTMYDLAADCIEKYGYLILVVVLAITLIFAVVLGFGNVDSEQEGETARLIASISFPMSGIMLFVLGQSLSLYDKYGSDRNVLDRVVDAYKHMSVISAITLVGSALTGLFSFQYYKSGGDTLLIVAIYFFLSTLVLLIINTIFFTIYTLTVKKTIR
jgi:uncharacterized membrane protein